jgi:hypothetical protein
VVVLLLTPTLPLTLYLVSFIKHVCLYVRVLQVEMEELERVVQEEAAKEQQARVEYEAAR